MDVFQGLLQVSSEPLVLVDAMSLDRGIGLQRGRGDVFDRAVTKHELRIPQWADFLLLRFRAIL